jgi:hypothetical protein
MKRAYGKSFTRRRAVKIAGIGLMGAKSGASADPQGETMISLLRDPVTPILGRPSRDSPTRPPFAAQACTTPRLADQLRASKA